jgi:hypothetical protein
MEKAEGLVVAGGVELEFRGASFILHTDDTVMGHGGLQS